MLKKTVGIILLALASGGPASAAHNVVLTWTASTDAQTGLTYSVYRAAGTIGSGNSVSCPAAPGASWTKITSGIVNGTLTYTDATVTVGNGYCYYATSVLGGLESVPSNVATGVILPAPPTAVTATAN